MKAIMFSEISSDPFKVRSRYQTGRRNSRPGRDRIARLFDHAANSVEIDTHELALPFDHLAGNENVLDVARIHQRHDRPRDVIEREDINSVGGEHDDIGCFPGGQSADLVFQMGCFGASDRGHCDNLAAGHELWQVLFAGERPLVDKCAL
jgi:hypothetical protein